MRTHGGDAGDAFGPTFAGAGQRARQDRASVFTIFAERGFEETTASEAAEAAGISRASFFRYFSSKEEAVFAAQEAMGEEIAAALAERPAERGRLDGAAPRLRRRRAQLRAQPDRDAGAGAAGPRDAGAARPRARAPVAVAPGDRRGAGRAAGAGARTTSVPRRSPAPRWRPSAPPSRPGPNGARRPT